MIGAIWEHRRPLGPGAAPPGTPWPKEWVFGEVNGRPLVLCFQGELNGQKGLVPSNFLEEVPDDVEVYLSDAPSHCAQDAPARSKAKRVSRRGQRPQLPSPRHRRARGLRAVSVSWAETQTPRTFSLPSRGW